MECPDHKKSIIEPVKGDGPDEADPEPIPFTLNLCFPKIITQNGREGDMPQVRENGSQESHKETKSQHISHILCSCKTQSGRDHVDHSIHYFIELIRSVGGEAHGKIFEEFFHNTHP